MELILILEFDSCNIQLLIIRGAPDLKFSNPAGTGFTGFAQKFRPEFRPDLPDLI